MKKILTNLFTILISCAVILSTLFVTLFGSADAAPLTVKEESAPKSGINEYSREIPIRNLNISRFFTKDKGEKSAEPRKDDASAASNDASAASENASAASSAAVSTAATSAAATSTAKPTKTTAPIVPLDESKNIQYIKDPNYKSPYYIVVYTGSQSAVVYGKDESGNYTRIIKAFTVSTGRHNSTPTRKGVYKIRAKYRWRKLMGNCYGQYSSSISPDYLFHSVPYANRSVNSLYNASYNNLGRAVSHGCIRMCVRDCKWIYDNCPIGTQVHVVWESGPKGQGVPRRKSGSKYSGWDPSDQWASGNPYFKNVSTTESQPVPTVKTTKSSKTTAATSADSSSKVTQSTAAPKSSSTATTTTTTATTTTTTAASSSEEEVAVG